tara:strand:- start:255 stop:443 length:189 start_codon:yes stop_codon:yes gene_type:complete
MDMAMAVDMVARMTAEERQTFVEEIEKRYPNLIDELGHYINVTQVERDMQMGDGQLELDIDG